MPTLHLICGLPGSGKSTLARKLEGEKDAVRLTPDEWLMRLQIDGCDEKARSAIEAIQWDLRATHAGTRRQRRS
jgi:predicted kinase